MINDYIATLTVDQLHEYVTTMATKITKQQMSSVVSIGTIVSKNGTNYLVQLNTSATPVTARLLKPNEVYNINDEVYLTQLSGTAGGETQLIYYIYGRVQETNNLLNNITNETAFYSIINKQNPNDVTLERYQKYPTVKIDCECSCDFTGPTSFTDFGIQVIYKSGDKIVETQKFNTSHMQGQPHYKMTEIPQSYIFTRQCTNFDSVKITSFGTDETTTIDNIKISLGYLADFDFKVNIEALGQSYWPRDMLASNITLQAKATYQGQELTDEVEYYWFIKAKTSSSTPKIPEIGGNDWVCLNSSDTSQVAGIDEPITIWDTESNLITLNRANNIISQNSKFVNNIKCVAVCHGINVTSNILELIDFQHEQYDVYLTSSLSEPYQLLKEDDIVDLVCHIDNDNQNSNILSTLNKTYTWYTILREATSNDIDSPDNTFLFFTATSGWKLNNIETRYYNLITKTQAEEYLSENIKVYIGQQINSGELSTLRILYNPTHHLANAVNYYMTGDGQQEFFCIVTLTPQNESATSEETETTGTSEISDSCKVTTNFVDRLWTVYSEKSSEENIDKPYYYVQENGTIETNININNDPNSSATWQLEVTEQSVWQCQKVDSALLGAATTWSTPILLRGRDGIVGADGATLQLLFKLQDSQPGKPTLDYEQYPTIPFDVTKHTLKLKYAVVTEITSTTTFPGEIILTIDDDDEHFINIPDLDLLDGNHFLYYYVSIITSDTETEVGKTDIQKILLEASNLPLKVTFDLTSNNTITYAVNNSAEAQTVIGLDWSQTDSAFQPGDKLWMSQKSSNQDPSFWSTPIPFSGQDGATIKYMYSLRAKEVVWVDKSNWNSNGTTPDIKGQSLWTDDPQGITETDQYEYVSVRRKDTGSTTWGNWSTPTIWAKWGEHGQDGSGIEYVFYLSDSDSAPAAPTYAKGNRGDQEKYDYTQGWQDDPPAPTSTQPYVYVSRFKTNPDGEPILDTPEQEGQTPIATGTAPALWTRYPLNYEISLDEDFISIPTNNEGKLVSDFQIPAPVLTVYKSGEPLAVEAGHLHISWDTPPGLWGVVLEQTGGSWKLTPEKENEEGKKSGFLEADTPIPDRSIIYITYKPSDVVLAETFIEIIPQKAGSDGSYVYALASANVLKFKKDETKFTPASVNITLHKRIGSGEASQVTDKDYYLTVSNGKITTYYTTANGKQTPSASANITSKSGYQFTITPTTTNIDEDIVIVIYEWGQYDGDPYLEQGPVVDKITINLIEYVTSPYSINLDNEYDSIVFTTDGQLVSNDPITINAEWYQGTNRVSTEDELTELYSIEPANPEFTVGKEFKTINDSTTTKIGIKITLSDLSKWTGTDATITFKHPSDNTITRTFKMKKIISNVDYDLIPSPKIINTSTTSEPKVSFSVLVKNATGTPTTLTKPTLDEDNNIIDTFVLEHYTSVLNTETGKYEMKWTPLTGEDSWTNINIEEDKNKFRLVDKAYETNKLLWDQEEIEFIENGTSPYNIHLDNEYDSIVFTSDGQLVSNDDIKINAEWYQGNVAIESSGQSIESLYTCTGIEATNWDADWISANNDNKSPYTGLILTLTKEKLAAWTSTDATITFMHPKDNTITRTFKMKKIIANVDYDLIPTKTVINTSTSEKKVSFSVLVKNATGKPTTQTAPTDTDTFVLEQGTSTWDYKLGKYVITAWGVPDCDDSTDPWANINITNNTNTFRLVDKTDKTLLWDQEEIELIKNGSNGTGTPGTDGDTIAEVRAFYRTNTFSPKPASPNSAPNYSSASDTWTFIELSPTSSNKYVYSSLGTATKRGGTENFTYSNWTTPELWNAYGLEVNIPPHAAVTFTKLFTDAQGTTHQGLKYDPNGNVYINASLIKTGLLSVGDNGELLSAGWNDGTPTVTIAGWTATTQMLCNNKTPGQDDSVCLIPAGESGSATIGGQETSGWVITAGKYFGVTKSGGLYCTKGRIGGWDIGTAQLLSIIERAPISGTQDKGQYNKCELGSKTLALTFYTYSKKSSTDSPPTNPDSWSKLAEIGYEKIQLRNDAIKLDASSGTGQITLKGGTITNQLTNTQLSFLNTAGTTLSYFNSRSLEVAGLQLLSNDIKYTNNAGTYFGTSTDAKSWGYAIEYLLNDVRMILNQLDAQFKWDLSHYSKIIEYCDPNSSSELS